MWMLQNQNVAGTEIGTELIADALAVLGALVDPSWVSTDPPPSPRTKAELIDGWIIQP